MPVNAVPVAAALPDAVEIARRQVREFIATAVLPLEQQAFLTGVDDKLRIQLQDAARTAGVLALRRLLSSAAEVQTSRPRRCCLRRRVTVRSARWR